MHRADKAVLRLALGLGLAGLVAYGGGVRAPFVTCVMAVVVLCRPGPPIPILKGAVLAAVFAALTATGMLMVPLLENYALAGVALTGALLYAVFLSGARTTSKLPTILVIALTVIPVAGVAEQALASAVIRSLAVGLFIGILVSSAFHALFPDAPAPAPKAAAPAVPGPEAARWMAMQATLVIMPVFVLALTNPAFYLAAIMKTAALGQQASSLNARSAGQELVGSTLMAACMAALVWLGLSLLPNLWMLTLWLMAAALWAGARLFRIKATAFSPSFWVNAMMTMLILLGPAIEDSANGKDVFKASVIRVTLFVVIALYAWATVWALERWRQLRSSALVLKRH